MVSKQLVRVEGVIGGEGEVIYYHHDNLGSTRLMTNESGEVVFDQDYLPFGGDLAIVGDLEPKNDVSEGYKYTGQREEVSIGLYYYGARFYDPELGRFITEDTYVGEIVDSQSQNIYIYTINNPMKYVDPTGHFSEEYDENYGYSTGGTVEQGDTLSDIALDIYGNESAVEALANMNDIWDIDKIYEGQRLMLPGVAIDNSGNGYMQPGFVDGAREVPDAYIVSTIVGTVALEAGGLEALSTAGSSAYAAADKAFEKGYYWANDKLGRFSNFLSDKIGRVFNRKTKIEKYTPINQGPLPDDVAKTFRSATYTRYVTEKEMTLYRVYGGKAGKLGSYWTRIRPQGSLQSVIDSALDQNWGNNATKVIQINVPKGIEVFEGVSELQRGLVGGGNQIWIKAVDPSWIIK